MDTKEFKISKDECQKMIGEFVCNGCGGKLEPIETVDNCDSPTFWSGCLVCSTFTWGTTTEVFKIAQQLVLKHHHIEYSHMGSDYGLEGDKLDYWNRSQISGTTGLVSRILKIQKELKTK